MSQGKHLPVNVFAVTPPGGAQLEERVGKQSLSLGRASTDSLLRSLPSNAGKRAQQQQQLPKALPDDPWTPVVGRKVCHPSSLLLSWQVVLGSSTGELPCWRIKMYDHDHDHNHDADHLAFVWATRLLPGGCMD